MSDQGARPGTVSDDVLTSWLGLEVIVTGRGRAKVEPASGRLVGAVATLVPIGTGRFALPPQRYEVLTVSRAGNGVFTRVVCAFVGAGTEGRIEVGPSRVDSAEAPLARRVEAEVPVELAWLDGALPQGVTGRTIDLSVDGLSALFGEQPPVMTSVAVQLDLGERGVVPMLGLSLGAGSGGHWRVSLRSMAPEAREQLAGFLRSVKTGEVLSTPIAASADDRAWVWTAEGLQAAMVDDVTAQGLNLQMQNLPTRGASLVVAVIGLPPRAEHVASLAGGLVRIAFDD
jgi:hypothetical protein